MRAVLLLLQATAATPPERIDLLRPVATKDCRAGTGEDIVVCAGRADAYRLRPLPPRPEPTLIPRAETPILGGAARAAAEVEAEQMPGGVQSNRAMIRLKMPF